MNLAIQQKWLKSKYMSFIEKISNKKFTLISVFMFLYVIFNLLDGDRGLISYYENQIVKKQLIKQKQNIEIQLYSYEKKNKLLTDNIDLDYLETLYRKKFMIGKEEEKIYVK